MLKNKKTIAIMLSITCLLLTGCSGAMRAYNPLADDNAPIEGYNDSDNNYSWNNETNGYSDPYGTAQEENLNSDYTVSETNSAMPSNPQYFTSQIGNVVHFDVDSIDLDEKSKNTLKLQAQWLAQHHHKIVIEGYTDNRGTKVYNIALGKHRASEVRDYLINLGVPANSIKTVSYGLERPVAYCQQEKCWAQNRRAHIVLH